MATKHIPLTRAQLASFSERWKAIEALQTQIDELANFLLLGNGYDAFEVVGLDLPNSQLVVEVAEPEKPVPLPFLVAHSEATNDCPDNS